MKATTYLLGAAAALTIIAGCTTAHSPAVFTQPSPVLDVAQPRITGSHKRITPGEMQSPYISNAWEAIRRLRPEFLTARQTPPPNGGASASPAVYLNGVRQGGLEALQTIPVDAIVEIRYVNARGMREWLGLNHASDAIVVRTSRTKS